MLKRADLRADLGRLIASGGVLAACNALLALVATRWLSPHDRGVMVLAVTIPSTISMLATLGLGNAMRAALPKADADGAHALRGTYALLFGMTAIGGAALSSIASLVAARVIVSELSRVDVVLAAACAGGTLVASVLLTDLWYAAGRFASGAAWAAGTGLAAVATTLMVRPDTVATFILAQYLPTALVLALALRALAKADLWSAPRWSRSTVQGLVSMGLPSLGFVAGTAITLRVDRLILGAFVAPAEVAAYALAATLSEVARLAPLAAGQLAMQRSAGRDGSGMRRLIGVAVGSVAAVGVPLAILSFPALPRVFGAAYTDSPKLLVLLLLAEVCFSTYVVAAMSMMGRGEMSRVGGIGAVGALASVPAYIIGAAVGGSVGCAVAGIGVYAGLAAWTLATSKETA